MIYIGILENWCSVWNHTDTQLLDLAVWSVNHTRGTAHRSLTVSDCATTINACNVLCRYTIYQYKYILGIYIHDVVDTTIYNINDKR